MKPWMKMVTVQIIYIGVDILVKLAGIRGFSLPVLIAYRFMVAAAVIFLPAHIFERNSRPRLSKRISLLAFGCALFGGPLPQYFFANSLVLTYATLTVAISNLIPAVSFLLCVIFRLEVLNLNTKTGQAKFIGTIFGVGGAMLIAFFKGPKIEFLSTHVDLLYKSQASGGHRQAHNHIEGLLFALASCFLTSLSFICQAKMSEEYPYPYSSTCLIAIMGSIEGTVFALCVERDWSQWKLGWNLKLLTVVCMGIFGSGITTLLIMSCVMMNGPVYIASFNPLQLVFIELVGTLFLKEKLSLGSVLGALLIICGLGLFQWGKSEELSLAESSEGSNHSQNVATPNIV